MSTLECSYCEESAQGNYSIHRDGMGEGPEVPLCDDCGGHVTPTCHEIWMAISVAYRKEYKTKFQPDTYIRRGY